MRGKIRRTAVIITLFLGFFNFASAQTNETEPGAGDRKLLKPDSYFSNSLNLTYIGEIKNRSYIKMTLVPAPGTKDQPEQKEQQLYKGSYYEAKNGKVYQLSAILNTARLTWEIKGYNVRRQYVCHFSGKENESGGIEGTWRNKSQTLPFYLFKKSEKDEQPDN